MANPIIVPETRDPTLWNRYGLLGAKIGMASILAVTALTALITGGIGIAGSVLPWIAALGAGAIVGTCTYAGSVNGKAELEQNKRMGRRVNPPTLNNDGLYHGLLNGGMIGLAAITTVASLAGEGLAAAEGFSLFSQAFTIGAAAMGAAFAGYYAADRQRDRMALEYREAEIYRDQIAAKKDKGQDKGLLASFSGPEQANSRAANENAVTAQDMEAINAKLSANKASAAQKLETSRLAAYLGNEPVR